MHDAAYAFVQKIVHDARLDSRWLVLDLGGREISDTRVHDLFDHKVTTVDITPDAGVDIVADAADWTPDMQYDVVLATEVFEHTPRWREIIDTARLALRDSGWFIATCASRDRPAHSQYDGGMLRDGEHYANVEPNDLEEHLAAGDWVAWDVIEADGYFGNDDLYCWARTRMCPLP